MPMQCTECGAAVDAALRACPKCGAPSEKFGSIAIGHAAGMGAAGSSSSYQRPSFGPYSRAAIGVTVVAVVFTLFALYSKHAHLDNVRRKCVETFELTTRCDCLVNEISKNTYAISFVPMFRFVSGLSPQKLAGIIREAAMACIEPR